MRYLLALLLLLTVACQNDLTLPSDTGLNPAPEGTANAIVDCAQTTNVGSVVRVELLPSTVGLLVNGSGSHGQVTVKATVLRDNSSIPGIQYHCWDYSAWVNFSIAYPAWMVSRTPQSATLNPNTVGNTKLIGSLGGKADTTWVYSWN